MPKVGMLHKNRKKRLRARRPAPEPKVRNRPKRFFSHGGYRGIWRDYN